jgi:hypothetical protein
VCGSGTELRPDGALKLEMVRMPGSPVLSAVATRKPKLSPAVTWKVTMPESGGVPSVSGMGEPPNRYSAESYPGESSEEYE